MFGCTAATEPVVNSAIFSKLNKRDSLPKLIIDLGVPRNVAIEVVVDFNVNYIDIEQLRELAEINLTHRKQELKEAKSIIVQRLKSFTGLFQQRLIERTLKRIVPEVKEMKRRTVENVYEKRIASLDPEARALVLEMMDYMEKKFVAIPMKIAKSEI